MVLNDITGKEAPFPFRCGCEDSRVRLLTPNRRRERLDVPQLWLYFFSPLHETFGQAQETEGI